MLFDGINDANSGMIERRSRTSFAQEALHGRGVRLAGVLKELQRHPASQPDILGFIHLTQPAASQLPQDAIVSDSFVDHRDRSGVLLRRLAIRVSVADDSDTSRASGKGPTRAVCHSERG